MADKPKYLFQEDGKWRVRIWHDHRRVCLPGTYETQEAAETARDGALGEMGLGESAEPVIVGVKAAEPPDESAVLERARARFQLVNAVDIRRRCQAVTLPGQASLIVNLADLHLGGDGTDVDRVLDETEQVAKTDGAWAVGVGDFTDNFIKPKFMSLRYFTSATIPEELVLFKAVMRRLAPKLLAYVEGNHNMWTTNAAGISYFEDVVASLNPNVLYDAHEVRFRLAVGERTWRYRARHRWPGNSYINPFHALMRGYREGPRYDVGIAAHTHKGGLHTWFVGDEGESVLGVLCGPYKRVDDYPRALGFPDPNQATAVAVLFDGRSGAMRAFEDLDEARRELRQAQREIKYA